MTTSQTSMVVGLFADTAQAEQAVQALEQAGFTDDQISYSGHGATKGGFMAGLKNLFTGEDTASHNVANDLTSMGMPENDARYYQREYEAGRSVVSVIGDSGMQEASTIMAQYGGYGANNANYDSTTQDTTTTAQDMTANTAQDTSTTDGRRLQLREEQLQVYKQPVQTGAVNLHKEVISEQKNIDVPVSHEEVYIERRPASGQVSNTPIGEDETISVPVSKEQVDVSKQSVVTGEVAVGKRTVQGTQQVSDTVRREEARVDNNGEVNVQGDNTGFTKNQSDPTNP